MSFVVRLQVTTDQIRKTSAADIGLSALCVSFLWFVFIDMIPMKPLSCLTFAGSSLGWNMRPWCVKISIFCIPVSPQLSWVMRVSLNFHLRSTFMHWLCVSVYTAEIRQKHISKRSVGVMWSWNKSVKHVHKEPFEVLVCRCFQTNQVGSGRKL